MAACAACGQVNPEIARFCLACGAPIELTPGPMAEERRRDPGRVRLPGPLDPVTLKGKAKPVAVYQALAPRARLGTDVMTRNSTPI